MGLAFGYLCLMCICNQRLSLSASLITCASDYLNDNPLLVFLPLSCWALELIWLLVWGALSVQLYSVGLVEPDPDLPIANIVWTNGTRFAFYYHMVSFFWISLFISGLSLFIVSGTTAQWYYSEGAVSDTKGKTETLMVAYWCFKYHQGTIAFGTVVVTITNIMKLLF